MLRERLPARIFLFVGLIFQAVLMPGSAAGLLIEDVVAVEPSGNKDQSVEVTFVANMGVLVETGGKKILFDALFRTPNPMYAAPPTEVLEKMETGKSPFDGLDLILATHTHADHFDAASVVRCLRHNKKAVFVSSPEALAAMEALEEPVADLKSRIVVVDLKPQETETYELGGIQLRAFRTLHSGARETPNNVMFLVDVGGKKVFHEGDSEGEVEVFREHALQDENIDVALVHFWWPFVEQGQEILNSHMDPDQIVLLHTPIEEMEKFRKLVADHPTELPNVSIPTRPMEKIGF